MIKEKMRATCKGFLGWAKKILLGGCCEYNIYKIKTLVVKGIKTNEIKSK